MSLLSTVFYIDDCIKYVLCNRFPCKELTEIKDIVYDEDMPETGKLDIIYDENQRGKLTPGWITGDKKMRRSYCQHMARTGAFTININYCLGPKYQFPDYMKQVYKALQWIVNNAVKYGLDLDNLVISGDSAGGRDDKLSGSSRIPRETRPSRRARNKNKRRYSQLPRNRFRREDNQPSRYTHDDVSLHGYQKLQKT